MTIKTRNIHIEALAKTLGTPSLDGLAYALRHPETWPEGFVWDFSQCDNCAMGLAHALWCKTGSLGEDNNAAVSTSARLLAMPWEEADQIFMNTALYTSTKPKRFLGFNIGTTSFYIDFEDVTPGMVADAIDAYIARSEH